MIRFYAEGNGHELITSNEMNDDYFDMGTMGNGHEATPLT
jgi:hypothetical protein